MLPLTELVDSRVGVIRSCGRLPKDWREPARPVVYGALLSNFDGRRPGPAERLASGKGMTDGDAERGAIVEAIERYCAQQLRQGAVVFGAASTLDAPSIAPRELVLYSDRQYASPGFHHRKPAAGEELTWARGELVGSGEPVYAPASLVYMNFAGQGGRERFTFPNSSGLAGGRDLRAATLSALYELVERDAFLITWLTRVAAPRIAFPDGPGIAARIRGHYRRFGIELAAFDLTTDVEIPVVMAVAFDRSGELPAASVGLGCDLDPASALDRAAMELVQVRSGLVPRFRGVDPPALVSRYEDVRTIEDHAALAARPENLGEFDFLLEGEPEPLRDRRPGVDDELSFCSERLEACGCRVAFVELTLPDVEPFGICVVRAIATGLQPIHFGFGEERLGGRRLFATGLTEADLNPCPHPLA